MSRLPCAFAASILIAAATLPAAAPSPASAATATVRLGALEISYDTERWAVTVADAGPNARTGPDFDAPPDDETVRFACRADICRGERGLPPVVVGYSRQVDESGYDPHDPGDPGWIVIPDDHQDGRGRLAAWDGMSIGGLVWRGQIIHGPCRAYTPSKRVAATIHGGRTYVLTTGHVSGCGRFPSVPDEAVMELLSGARLVDP